jgi:hypothetical protein
MLLRTDTFAFVPTSVPIEVFMVARATAMQHDQLTPNPNTARVRVLIALEWRLERDTVSQAMAILRPGWDVSQVAPCNLDATVQRERPDVVVCSELTSTVESEVPMWFLLHPYGSQRCVVAFDGQRQEEPNLTFAAILAHVDGRHG